MSFSRYWCLGNRLTKLSLGKSEKRPRGNFPQELKDTIAFHFPLNLLNTLGCFPYVQRVKLCQYGWHLWSRYSCSFTYRLKGKYKKGQDTFGEFLAAHRVPTFYRQCIFGAATTGNLPMIIYFSSAGGDMFFTPDVMNIAACHGHLHIVNWLYENRPDGPTSSAVYSDEVYQWLKQLAGRKYLTMYNLYRQ